MKKTSNIPNSIDEDDGMLPEYDFTGQKGVRGKYYRARQKGYAVRIHHKDGTTTVQHFGPTIALDADVAAYFPDPESVNNALRSLIALVPKRQIGELKSKYAVKGKTKKKPAKK